MLWVQVAVLVALLGTQFILRSFDFGLRRRATTGIWLLGGAVIFFALVEQSRLLYLTWQADPVAKLFLPPHQTIFYFLGYVLSRLWAPWLASLAASLAGIFAAHYLNRLKGEVFFRKEEPLMFGAAIFFSGYPVFFVYILVLALGAAFNTAAYQLFHRGRAPLYFLWFPAALFAILITYGFLPHGFIASFNF